MFFWNSCNFSIIQQMLAIWSLVPLAFLKQTWTSGISRFHIWKFHLEFPLLCTVEGWLGEFWALLYKHVRWVQLCGSLSILWHCLSLGLEWTDLFQSCGHCWVFQICWHIECKFIYWVLIHRRWMAQVSDRITADNIRSKSSWRYSCHTRQTVQS